MGVAVLGGSGISGGADTRFAAESVDLDAGVVGEYEFAVRVAAVVLGLFACVFLERGAVLDTFRQQLEVREQCDLDAVACGNGSEVAKLAGVG